MNRFSNYLECSKLAKMELVAAQEKAADKDLWRSQQHMAKAVQYALTAMNNVASLYFERRRKV